ncbi:MAG: anhydro-N-acetylmuramic acid kinase [Planctomycetaceae bacterium]|jgi:anhydro-N-acetylmuramic acid kinase|nr:anhydro-N-acetylmuramic acid kinase [Planctomycetaceae bacterium]
MFFHSRSSETLNKTSNVRWFVGLYLTTNGRRLEAGLIGIHGSGSGAPIEVSQGLTVVLPEKIVSQVREINENNGLCFGKDAFLNHVKQEKSTPKHEKTQRLVPKILQEQMLEIQVELVHELLNKSGVAPDSVFAVGVHGPGDLGNFHSDIFWNSAAVASRTGLNMVDGFAEMDRAVSGNGSPLIPLPMWILMHSASRHRLLIDLGQQIRVTFLPSAGHATKEQIQHDILGPCGLLIDPLAAKLSEGEQTFDEGGRLTVQGLLIPELAEFWSDNLVLRDSNSLLAEGIQKAKAKEWSLRDLLCTAVHCIQNKTATFIKEHYEPLLEEVEFFVTGGCQHHGLLMKQLRQELQVQKLQPLGTAQFSCNTFDALCVAVLTYLAVDQIPGNLPHLTHADTTAVLGRFTPGTPQNWLRLLQCMAGVKPAVRTLRSAM